RPNHAPRLSAGACGAIGALSSMAAINQDQWLLEPELADLAITIASIRAQTMRMRTLYFRRGRRRIRPGQNDELAHLSHLCVVMSLRNCSAISSPAAV